MSVKKYPLTPFINPDALAKANRLVQGATVSDKSNKSDEEVKNQLKAAVAARDALARTDIPLYSSTLHDY